MTRRRKVRRRTGRRRYRRSYTGRELVRLARKPTVRVKPGKKLIRGYRWYKFYIRGRKVEVILTPKQQLALRRR